MADGHPDNESCSSCGRVDVLLGLGDEQLCEQCFGQDFRVTMFKAAGISQGCRHCWGGAR